jgi:tRNA (guanine26-N2/guanine27-N2)-dimethyltransferase
VINGTSITNDSMNNFSIVKSNKILTSKNEMVDIGPIWTGKLQNKKVLAELRTILFEKKLNTKNELWKLLNLLEDEADAPIFFYTTDGLASILKKSPPKMQTIFKMLQKKGYKVYRTHFCPTGFKTNAPKSDIEKVFKSNPI